MTALGVIELWLIGQYNESNTSAWFRAQDLIKSLKMSGISLVREKGVSDNNEIEDCKEGSKEA